MTTRHQYTEAFFAEISRPAADSARVIVPIVMDLVAPKSTVDVGCGRGEWLQEFRRAGVSEILGIDGGYVPRDRLKIPPNCFLAADLSKLDRLSRQFDLAVSLEVAEHLPAADSDRYVDLLTSAAPVVLFSAAVPNQGGTGHINEQWPAYWADLFAKRNYLAADIIRPLVWGNQDVAWWYRQNMILYVSRHYTPHSAKLADSLASSPSTPKSRVHPALELKWLWARRTEETRRTLESLPVRYSTIAVLGLHEVAFEQKLNRRLQPFPSSDRGFSGHPKNDAEAIEALSRLTREDGSALVVLWNCFWYKKAYPQFWSHLCRTFEKIGESEALMCFAPVSTN